MYKEIERAGSYKFTLVSNNKCHRSVSTHTHAFAAFHNCRGDTFIQTATLSKSHLSFLFFKEFIVQSNEFHCNILVYTHNVLLFYKCNLLNFGVCARAHMYVCTLRHIKDSAQLSGVYFHIPPC